LLLCQILHRQAVVMGYGGAFFMPTLFLFQPHLLVMLLKKPASAATEPAH
jgi:DHA2 family multidrug resistance protein